MHLSPILDPITGRRPWSYGGEDTWKQFTHRGFIVSIEWAIHETMRRTPPVMAIWPAGENLAAASYIGGFMRVSQAGVWVITRNVLTDFVGFNAEGKCTGGASLHCMREAREALSVLGKDPNDRQNFTALVDCVVKHAEHLHHCPPTPSALQRKYAGAPMWEVTAKDKATGKVLTESEV